MKLQNSEQTVLQRATPYMASFVFTGCLFLALPFTQLVSDSMPVQEPPDGTRIVMAPPPPPPESEPPPEETANEEDLKLDREMQKISLNQIDLALNAGTGGMGGASTIQLTTFDLADDISADLVFDIADLDEAPEPIHRVAPVYPKELKRKGVQGRVMIMFIIDEHGNISNARVSQSPHPDFSSAALIAINKWKFKPGKKDGKPVKTRVELPLAFTVNT